MSRIGLIFTAVIFSSILFLTPPVSAKVSVNVPLGHWGYGAIDKLKALGLIHSDIRGTRPWTRMELARLIVEADEQFQEIANSEEEEETKPRGRTEITRAILGRLKGEFSVDLDEVSGVGGVSTYIKPLEDVYLHYFYGNNDFNIENDKGQKLAEDSNFRLGFSTHGAAWSHIGFYLNPEYRYSDDQFGGDDQEVRLFEGYGKLEFFNIELQVGRDTLWWGTGRHGSMILTHNARPFDLVKLSNPNPVVLPWIFKYLGLCKFQWFWTELESNRVIPNTEFMGFRVNIKPAPFFEIGAARTYQLGGRGSGVKGISDLNFSDWMNILFEGNAQDELDVNQIAGIDGILYVNNLDQWIPVVKSVQIWGEYYGEDESGNWISDIGYVAGIKFGDLFLLGRTDLIFEYADNAESGDRLVWYNNAIYRSGYRYKGEVMGHNMDTEAQDYFVHLENYLTPDFILGLDYNYQERVTEGPVTEYINRFDLDLTWQRTETLRIQAGYRYETIENLDLVRGDDQDNHIFWLFADYSF
ncbi:MAG: capsule assembly Wzi family protein [Syntrophobacterales bacterium]|jgi:hypothetical protein